MMRLGGMLRWIWCCPKRAGAEESVALLRTGSAQQQQQRALSSRRGVNPAPEVFASAEDAHKTLASAETHGRRVVIVGDVHGCAAELRELLDKVNFSTAKGDLAVFVGDLVAKGPDSAGVLAIVRDLGAAAIGVRGNHDHYVLLREGDDLMPEKEHSKLARGGLLKEDIAWLRKLPLSIKLEEHNLVVVHAGLLPGTVREENSLQDMLHMRNVVFGEDGCAKGSSSADQGKPWVELWGGPEHVVFGHDAMRKLQRAPFATGLDTGCVYGGHLSCLVLPEWKIVQVDAHKTHKPPGT